METLYILRGAYGRKDGFNIVLERTHNGFYCCHCDTLLHPKYKAKTVGCPECKKRARLDWQIDYDRMKEIERAEAYREFNKCRLR